MISIIMCNIRLALKTALLILHCERQMCLNQQEES